MDELNAHQFWGISPAIDLNAVLRVKSETAVDDNAPLKFLQVNNSGLGILFAWHVAKRTQHIVCLL